jgi:hypothetical protein
MFTAKKQSKHHTDVQIDTAGDESLWFTRYLRNGDTWSILDLS